MLPGDATTLFKLAQAGDRACLARAISHLERGSAIGAQLSSIALATKTLPYSIGVTGAPGSGKSTLTNSLIKFVRDQGSQIAVLAVDPSSPFSGGAILGDRVRMQEHSLDPMVYIRSMATRGHQGGLAVCVPEAIRLLGAVNFAFVIIETVGVGQVEVEIANEADTTVVVVNPGWGDAIQANKAGLMEIADIFVINKSDRPGAKETRRDLESMLDMSRIGSYRPSIIETTAISDQGTPELWKLILEHRDVLSNNGELEKRRQLRMRTELKRSLEALVRDKVEAALELPEFDESISKLYNQDETPSSLALDIFKKLFQNK